jgi:HlyD family secretion protein
MRERVLSLLASRRARLAIPLLLAALILFSGWTVSNQLAASRQGEWVKVTRGEIASGIDVTGTLASVVSDAFGPPQVDNMWDFKISMLAPEGSDVKAGTPLVGFDTSELQKRLDEKTAERDEAAKQIEKKRADLALRQRDEQLHIAEAEARLRKAALKLEAPPDVLGSSDRRTIEIDHSIATREVGASRTRMSELSSAADAEIRLLESRHRNAASEVEYAKDGIRRMTVTAPRDGTVVWVTDWRGDKKKVGDTTWWGQKIVEIPDLRRMKANGEVDEADAGKVRAGQRVSVRLDAHPDDLFHGTITTVGRTVQQKQGTQNPVKALRIEIALDRTDAAKMRPGMRFKGTVELQRERAATLIPVAAVFASDRGPVAYVRSMLGARAVPLKLGLENAESVQVVSGLSPGDRILIPKKETESENRQ